MGRGKGRGRRERGRRETEGTHKPGTYFVLVRTQKSREKINKRKKKFK